jgi:predicted nucleotidyltransferase
MPTETKLIDQIGRQISQPASPAIYALTDRLLADYGDAIKAILFYGSCLRTGEDRGGLVDLYVLVDRYRAIEPRRLLAALNKLLPPNVFYIEVPFEDRV